MKLAPILVILLLAGAATLTVLAEQPWATRGTPQNVNQASFVRNYPLLSPTNGSIAIGTQAWRVVNGTGNCCENHITVTSTGRIIDIGASYPVFSDNGGTTWKRFVPSAALLIGAEGSGGNAPNGDWVGMTWDPYTGDRVIAYKYVKAEDAWYSSQVALHSPAYDRPWIGVIPGPITFAGQTHPYAVLMRGGTAAKFTYVSYDGLTYAEPQAGELSLLTRETAWLDEPANLSWVDWVQPIASSRVMPLPGGGALAAADRLCAWMHVETDMSERCFSFPDGSVLQPNSAPRFDSKGRIHAFDAAQWKIVHRMSEDGGRTWKNTNLSLPYLGSFTNGQIDSAVNGALDMAVVGVRVDVWTGTGMTSKIIVYKISNLSSATPTIKAMQVGNGDRLFGSGINSPYSRMDFMTVGLLPSGKAVTTFGDWVHSTPRIAIEQ